jgi:hypothetical protein
MAPYSTFFSSFKIFAQTTNGGNSDSRRGDVQLAQGARGREGEQVGIRGESDVDDVERCHAERHVKSKKCDVNRYVVAFEKSSQE